jgi:hypothetical protein
MQPFFKSSKICTSELKKCKECSGVEPSWSRKEPKLLAGAGICSFGSGSGSDLRSILNPQVGICNLSPHLRNSAILWTTKSILELRTKKSCGIAIADLQNLTSTIPQLSTVSGQFCYFLVTFPQLRMVLKNNQKYF